MAQSTSLAFPVEEYERRLQNVTLAMKECGLDALIAYGIQLTLPGHVAWMVGSEPRMGLTKTAMAVVVPSSDRPLRVVGRPELGGLWIDDVDVSYGYDLASLIKGVLPHSVRTVGIAGWEVFPLSVYIQLEESYPNVAFQPASDLLLNLRMIKSDAEIAVLRQAASIAQAGVVAVYSAVGEGVRERDLLAEYERAVRANGSDELPFATQIASGPKTALVTAHSTERRIQPGDIVRSDTGAMFRGYCSDISRGTVVQPASDQVMEIVETCATLYEAALSAIRPGVSFREVMETATEVAEEESLGEYLGTLTVHGIGCNQDEYPHWSAGSAAPSHWTRGCSIQDADQFVEGMVCCFEPGIYVEGVGGLRLEDPFVVTANGIERLAPALATRLW